MGLDITAYRKLAPAINPAIEDGCPVDWENHFHVTESMIGFSENNWPGRTKGLTCGIYTFDESFGFQAGSYSGYNEWRELLAQFAGHGSARAVWDGVSHGDGAFVELIDFADNEGCIGPEVAAKLAKDFADHQERADKFNPEQAWWHQAYGHWRKAFEMAADGGAVEFH